MNCTKCGKELEFANDDICWACRIAATSETPKHNNTPSYGQSPKLPEVSHTPSTINFDELIRHNEKKHLHDSSEHSAVNLNNNEVNVNNNIGLNQNVSLSQNTSSIHNTTFNQSTNLIEDTDFTNTSNTSSNKSSENSPEISKVFKNLSKINKNIKNITNNIHDKDKDINLLLGLDEQSPKQETLDNKEYDTKDKEPESYIAMWNASKEQTMKKRFSKRIWLGVGFALIATIIAATVYVTGAFGQLTSQKLKYMKVEEKYFQKSIDDLLDSLKENDAKFQKISKFAMLKGYQEHLLSVKYDPANTAKVEIAKLQEFSRNTSIINNAKLKVNYSYIPDMSKVYLEFGLNNGNKEVLNNKVWIGDGLLTFAFDKINKKYFRTSFSKAKVGENMPQINGISMQELGQWYGGEEYYASVIYSKLQKSDLEKILKKYSTIYYDSLDSSAVSLESKVDKSIAGENQKVDIYQVTLDEERFDKFINQTISAMKTDKESFETIKRIVIPVYNALAQANLKNYEAKKSSFTIEKFATYLDEIKAKLGVKTMLMRVYVDASGNVLGRDFDFGIKEQDKANKGTTKSYMNNFVIQSVQKNNKNVFGFWGKINDKKLEVELTYDKPDPKQNIFERKLEYTLNYQKLATDSETAPSIFPLSGSFKETVDRTADFSNEKKASEIKVSVVRGVYGPTEFSVKSFYVRKGINEAKFPTFDGKEAYYVDNATPEALYKEKNDFLWNLKVYCSANKEIGDVLMPYINNYEAKKKVNPNTSIFELILIPLGLENWL